MQGGVLGLGNGKMRRRRLRGGRTGPCWPEGQGQQKMWTCFIDLPREAGGERIGDLPPRSVVTHSLSPLRLRFHVCLQGKKGKKEKKGKKKKDPTADRSIESLFAELVSNGILVPCPHVHVRDYLGSSSYMQVRLCVSGPDIFVQHFCDLSLGFYTGLSMGQRKLSPSLCCPPRDHLLHCPPAIGNNGEGKRHSGPLHGADPTGERWCRGEVRGILDWGYELGAAQRQTSSQTPAWRRSDR